MLRVRLTSSFLSIVAAVFHETPQFLDFGSQLLNLAAQFFDDRSEFSLWRGVGFLKAFLW